MEAKVTEIKIVTLYNSDKRLSSGRGLNEHLVSGSGLSFQGREATGKERV